MSNLSQFFGGGGPSNIIRGSTSVASTFVLVPSPFSNAQLAQPAIGNVNTGFFVDPETTYLTQGCRGNLMSYNSGAFIGSGSARINGSGEIVVTSGTGSAFNGGQGFQQGAIPNSSTVDWEAVEYA